MCLIDCQMGDIQGKLMENYTQADEAQGKIGESGRSREPVRPIALRSRCVSPRDPVKQGEFAGHDRFPRSYQCEGYQANRKPGGFLLAGTWHEKQMAQGRLYSAGQD